MEDQMRASNVHSGSIPIVIIGAFVALGVPAAASANVITDWDEIAIGLLKPLPNYPAQRIMGMMHCAMFDAVNSIERRYRPYLVQLPAEPTTSKEAAAAAAAAFVLATVIEKETKARSRIISLRSLTELHNRKASDSVKRLRQRCWQHAPTTERMRQMPIVRGRRQASMWQRRSLRPQRGQM
jgi:hypothetical protein